MGARLAAILAIHHPERVRSLVLGGLAANMIHGLSGGEEIADALLAPALSAVKGSVGRAFRMFAEQTRSDLEALAACIPGVAPADCGRGAGQDPLSGPGGGRQQ